MKDDNDYQDKLTRGSSLFIKRENRGHGGRVRFVLQSLSIPCLPGHISWHTIITSFNMKFYALASLLALASATPTPTQPESGTARLAKRATISDAANIGYASLNGG